MEQRKFGPNGVSVGALGYGAMVLEGYYGGVDEAAAIEVVRAALDAGMTMIDTADAYGNGHNETLLSRALEGRQDAFVASKFGIVFEGDGGSDVPTGWGFSLKINGKPDYAKKCLDDSLTRLKRGTLDLWYLHYPDPAVPIEDTVAAMADCVRTGKAKGLGLSNVTAEQVRKAHAVHPITAVQYEYSLFRREAEDEILPVCKELGIGFVPWSPLGGGFLTGAVTKLDEKDFRNANPKYTGDNFKMNQDRFAPLMGLAKENGLTPAQLSLAWLLHQGDNIVPIPGTRNPARIAENAEAVGVSLASDMLDKIEELAPKGAAQGATLLK